MVARHIDRRERRSIALSSGQKPSGLDKYFEGIVEKHSPQLHHVALSILRKKEDAEEVVQIALVKAYINLHGFTEKERETLKVKEWLCQIVRHEAYNHTKVRSKFISLEQYEENGFLRISSGQYDRPDITIIRTEVQEIICEMLTNLPKRMAKILAYRYEQNLSYEEIARLRNRYFYYNDTGGLRVYRTRAIARLRKLAKVHDLKKEDLCLWNRDYELFYAETNRLDDSTLAETVTGAPSLLTSDAKIAT